MKKEVAKRLWSIIQFVTFAFLYYKYFMWVSEGLSVGKIIAIAIPACITALFIDSFVKILIEEIINQIYEGDK